MPNSHSLGILYSGAHISDFLVYDFLNLVGKPLLTRICSFKFAESSIICKIYQSVVSHVVVTLNLSIARVLSAFYSIPCSVDHYSAAVFVHQLNRHNVRIIFNLFF